MSQNELWEIIAQLRAEVQTLQERVNILARRSLLDEHGKDFGWAPIPDDWKDELL